MVRYALGFQNLQSICFIQIWISKILTLTRTIKTTSAKNCFSYIINLSALKKFILLILFINFFTVGYNQVIKGTILDKETKNTIPHATVYFSGTFVGTTTDQNGYFELDITKYASRPLAISAIGYYSYTLIDFSKNDPFIIYLTPKAYELEEVVITAKSYARERKANLKLFKNAFLGKTFNARKCEIINENDITFNYGSDDDTLKAFALKPILVNNRALGYKVTYYLDKFEYYRKSNVIFFTGNIIFNEDLSTEETYKRFHERRKNSYVGSRMYFFRALWANKLTSNKINIKNSRDKNPGYKQVVIQDDYNKKFLKYNEDLDIYCKTRWSKIIFLKEQVFFDQDGFFDPSGIQWEGEMARKRIADWLPYEY